METVEKLWLDLPPSVLPSLVALLGIAVLALGIASQRLLGLGAALRDDVLRGVGGEELGEVDQGQD